MSGSLFRKWLFDGTVPSNKKLYDGTVPSNKKLYDGRVPSNKKLYDGTPRHGQHWHKMDEISRLEARTLAC